MAQSTDVSASTQYGFRLKMDDTYAFYTRNPSSGDFHALASDAIFQWTNDAHTSHCSCKMQYVRLYTEFAPNNQDMIWNLAVMDPDSNN